MTNPLAILPKSYVEALHQTGATLGQPRALLNVGQGNLHELVKGLRSRESSLRRDIGYLQQKLEIFDHKSPEVFAEEAHFSVDVTVLNSGMYPESKTRLGDACFDYGHSTFIRCGSCKHCSSKGRDVKCKILGTFDSEQGAPYDSPCLLRQMSIPEIAALSRRFKKRIQTLKDHRNIVRKQIFRTRELLNDSEKLPILPDSPLGGGRVKLQYGDRVRVFVFTPCCRKQDRNRWQPATILHSSGGGFTVFCFDRPIMTGRTPRRDVEEWRVKWPKHVWFHGSSQYIVLLEWEYQKLREMYRTNPKDPFLKTWKGHFEGDFEPHDYFSGQYVELPMERVVTKLFEGKEISPLGYDRRLMGADEAAEILGFDSIPDSPKDVVQYYRRLAKDGHPELHRAKDTLLLRLYGSHSAFD